jgi:threonine dehydrogenase-like Zn-dependent dehydrogenase
MSGPCRYRQRALCGIRANDLKIVVRGCFSYSPANFAQALMRLAHGTLRLEPWIVEAPLADGGRWFDRLIDAPGEVAKVLLVP